LGHLVAPYGEKDPEASDERALPWHKDLWLEIVRAAQRGTPNKVNLSWRQELNGPAASRYAASKPSLLHSFREYNSKRRRYCEFVRPFNFMLWFHARKAEEMGVNRHAILTPFEG
jgi:hypothetical protein